MGIKDRVTEDRLKFQEAIDTYYAFDREQTKAAEFLDIPRETFRNRLSRADQLHLKPATKANDPDKKRITDMRREIISLRADLKVLEDQSYKIEVVKELIHEVKKFNVNPPKWVQKPTSRTSGTNIGIPFLHLSDWHWDEVVDPATINHINAYNRQIAVRRAKACFETTVDLLIHHMAKPQYPHIVVGLGGDMLSGNIHEELRESNETVISKSIISCADNLLAGLKQLADNFGRVEIHAIPGNHGRMDKKPRHKAKVFETFEWLMYQFVARELRNDDRFYVDISDSPECQFNLYNTAYRMVHGDEYKGGGGVSGSFSPVVRGDLKTRARQMSVGQPYDYLLVGHFHQLRTPSKGTRMNGSLIGFSEYTFSKGFDFEVPMQSMWVTHPVWGVTISWPVILEKPGTRF